MPTLVPARPPAPATAAPDAATVARCQRLALALGWRMPFFLPVFARMTFRSGGVPTACVDLRGRCTVSPTWSAKLTDAELTFVLAHEAMHLLLVHHARQGARDATAWNIATDKVINRTLVDAAAAFTAGGLGAAPFAMPREGLIADASDAAKTAEALYSEVTEAEKQAAAEKQATGQMAPGEGCGLAPGDDDDDDGDGDGDGDGDSNTPSDDTLARQWGEAAVAAAAMAREAGSGAGAILARALTAPEPRVRWQALLRGSLHRALAEAGRDDVAWSRRGRRSTPEILLPGGVTCRCRAAVVIDSSGSVSDAALAVAVAETAAVVEATRVPVLLVIHDSVVQHAAWITPGGKGRVHADVQRRMSGRGGTDFGPAYARVGAEAGRFNVLVHLTDGEIAHWPERPSNVRRLVAAMLGRSGWRGTPPAGTTVVEVETPA